MPTCRRWNNNAYHILASDDVDVDADADADGDGMLSLPGYADELAPTTFLWYMCS